MIKVPYLPLVIQLALAIVLSLAWLTMLVRQFCAKRWRRMRVLAPCYLDSTTQVQLSVLQKIQTSYNNPASVSLTDIQALIQDLQQTYGEETTLEAVIQHITGEQLRLQLAMRQARRIERKALVIA